MSGGNALRSFFTRALPHIIFPTACPICGRIAEPACSDCLAKLCAAASVECLECGGNYPCSRHSCAPWLFSSTRYEGAARETALLLKYANNEELGRRMGEAIFEAYSVSRFALLPLSEAALIPIPLHRDSERKFNQAAAIAEGIKRAARGRITITEPLRWTCNEEHQTQKSRSERLSLRNDAFTADKSYKGGVAVIIDDVCTTGTTLRRAAETIRAAGGEPVGAIVWTRARLL